MKLISKSRFLEYLQCPKDAWFRLHRPEMEEFEVSLSDEKLMSGGYTVEEFAKQLKIFAGLIEVKLEVDELIKNKTNIIYQPTFVADGFMCRCDFLKWNSKTNKWDLYEVKGTNSLKDKNEMRDHISDLTFQVNILEKYGLKVGEAFIVHLNNKYVRKGDIDVEKLFVIADCTSKVKSKKEEIEKEMQKAKKYLSQTTEPTGGCGCHLFGHNSHCATFFHSHPGVPENSIYDLGRITPKKIQQLRKENVLHLHEIEDQIKLSLAQKNQLQAHKTGEIKINKNGIKKILNSYSYPLYFFDYETYAPAIPLYTGFGTYKRIPIQFSLHIIDEKGGAVRHVEFLHTENSDPTEQVAKLLEENIEPNGTVLAWNVGFEKGVTKEIGERLPKYAKVMKRIVDQMQDLMHVFSKQHYVHKDFQGSASIESVMNVLLPEMTYDHLPYTGADVGYVWWDSVVNNFAGESKEEREKKVRLILEYCKQDTFVMVEIWRILSGILNKS